MWTSQTRASTLGAARSGGTWEIPGHDVLMMQHDTQRQAGRLQRRADAMRGCCIPMQTLPPSWGSQLHQLTPANTLGVAVTVWLGLRPGQAQGAQLRSSPREPSQEPPGVSYEQCGPAKHGPAHWGQPGVVALGKSQATTQHSMPHPALAWAVAGAWCHVGPATNDMPAQGMLLLAALAVKSAELQ